LCGIKSKKKKEESIKKRRRCHGGIANKVERWQRVIGEKKRRKGKKEDRTNLEKNLTHRFSRLHNLPNFPIVRYYRLFHR
jgi:hypothetical protein